MRLSTVKMRVEDEAQAQWELFPAMRSPVFYGWSLEWR